MVGLNEDFTLPDDSNDDLSNLMSTPQDSEKCPAFAPDPGGDAGHFRTSAEISQETSLSDIQYKAIELALQGYDDSDLARQLSISRKTIWRWKSFDEVFRKALAEARLHQYHMATDRYQHLLLSATNVLARLLRDPCERTRYRAAQTVMNMAGSFRPKPPANKRNPRKPAPTSPRESQPQPKDFAQSELV